MELRLLWLYHDVMDLYGDRGNIQTLKHRCNKRGISFLMDTCGIGEEKNFDDYDIIFMGGGADKEQKVLSEDLISKKEGIKKALDSGTLFVLICGGYQLFGQYYEDSDQNKIEGLKLLNHYTIARTDKKRCVGNIIVDAQLDGEIIRICGFENHGGQTENVDMPLGRVVFGHGNQYKSEFEGVYTGQILGTYLHGPLLPKNAKLSDFIIKKSLSRRYGNVDLIPLDDTIENGAFNTMIQNLLEA